MKHRRVSRKQLLKAFERVCRAFNVVSRGFEPKAITAPCDGDKHDGTTQWAMKKSERGWMVVGGWRGCSIPLTRYNGRVKGRWNFLMLLEAIDISHEKLKQRRKDDEGDQGTICATRREELRDHR